MKANNWLHLCKCGFEVQQLECVVHVLFPFDIVCVVLYPKSESCKVSYPHCQYQGNATIRSVLRLVDFLVFLLNELRTLIIRDLI